jgi:putative ATP-binding cassette transporter
MARLKWLTLFTQSYSQVSLVFPYVVVSPAYFSGRVQLGGLMQIASAFNSVQRAVSVFITIYRDFAEWRAVIERLDGFDRAIAEAQVAAHTPPVIEVLAR